MMLGQALAALLWAGAGGGAQAEVTQIPASRALDAAVTQLAPPSRRIDPAPETTDRRPLEQVGREDRSVAPPPGPPSSSEGPLAQVNPGGRSAEAPAGPPKAARRVLVDPVTGQDRCDPARPTAAEPICQQRLETRAAAFERPSTAEDELLAAGAALQADPAAVARELGRGETLESQTAQGVAFQALQAGRETGPDAGAGKAPIAGQAAQVVTRP